MSFRVAGFWRRSGQRRGHKFGVVYRYVYLHLIDLNGELVAGARERPAKGNFQAAGIAIIGVIDLSGIQAQRRIGVTDKAQQEARLFVQVKTQRRLTLVLADDLIRVVAIDFFSSFDAELFVKRLDVQRKVQIGVNASCGVFRDRHHVYPTGNAQPTVMAVECSQAVAVRKMHHGKAFVRGLGEYLGRKMLAAKGGECALLDAACDFLERFCAADCREIFVEELIRGRENRFGFSSLVFPGSRRFGLFRRNDWSRDRTRRTAMAGVAGNLAVTLEVFLVDGHHHVDHFARGKLRFLVVFFKGAGDVAILAFDAKRCGDKLHRGNELLGRDSFERLDILVFFFGQLGARWGFYRSFCWHGLRAHFRNRERKQRSCARKENDFPAI